MRGGLASVRSSNSDVPAASVHPLPGKNTDAPGTTVRRLTQIGCAVEGESSLTVTPPTWRRDVDGPADLVEEVVRLVGIDKVRSVALPRAEGVAKPTATPAQKLERKLKRMMAARGLDVEDVDAVVNYVVSEDVVVERMLARGRADDTEEVIRNRMSVYDTETAPLLEYYGDQVKTIDAVGDVQDVHQRVLSALGAGVS